MFYIKFIHTVEVKHWNMILVIYIQNHGGWMRACDVRSVFMQI